jgi:pimeloyl-ACP methyl ester carboxylesterase
MQHNLLKQRLITGGNGLKLYAEETGPPVGPAILFIHGFSQSRVAWYRQMYSGLAQTFRLVCFDLRGHGLSEKPPEKEHYTNSEWWAADIAAIIEQLHLQQTTLVGVSYGGYIICDYLRHYGEANLSGINFVGAATKMGTPEAFTMVGKEFQALFPGFFSSDIQVGVAALSQLIRLCTYQEMKPEDFYASLGYNCSVPPYVRKNMFSRKLDNDDLLARLSVPLLVTHGLEDKIILPVAAEHHLKLVPAARPNFYARTGHLPFFENPSRFNLGLATFVRQCVGLTGYSNLEDKEQN